MEIVVDGSIAGSPCRPRCRAGDSVPSGGRGAPRVRYQLRLESGVSEPQKVINTRISQTTSCKLKERNRSFRSEGPKGRNWKERYSSGLKDPADWPVSAQIRFANRPKLGFK